MDVPFEEALRKQEGRMVPDQREKQRRRRGPRDSLKKVKLHLSQIVEAVIEDTALAPEKVRSRDADLRP